MDDQITPVSWYAVLTSGFIQPYLDAFELMDDPQLQPVEQDGTKFGKLFYSGFAGYTDYEGVLNETTELISLLTGALRTGQGPGPLSIVNIVAVFEDGREELFPPYGRPTRLSLDVCSAILVRSPGAKPRLTMEQVMVEYAIRSGDQLVKDVLRYMSNPLDFFGLFKILEVICWDLGKNKKAYRLVWERGWVAEKDLRAFRETAHNAHRHWGKKQPATKMDLQDAWLMVSRIIKEWIAEKAGMKRHR